MAEIQARLDAVESVDVLEELRSVASPELVEATKQRRQELYETMAKALAWPGLIPATPETAVAIKEYHKNVVQPLAVTLVHELLGMQMEVALHKAQLEAQEASKGGC